MHSTHMATSGSRLLVALVPMVLGLGACGTGPGDEPSDTVSSVPPSATDPSVPAESQSPEGELLVSVALSDTESVAFYEVQPGLVMIEQTGLAEASELVSFVNSGRTLVEKYERLTGTEPDAATAARLVEAQAHIDQLRREEDEFGVPDMPAAVSESMATVELEDATQMVEKSHCEYPPGLSPSTDNTWFRQNFCCGREHCRTNMEWNWYEANAREWEVTFFNQQFCGMNLVFAGWYSSSGLQTLWDEYVPTRLVKRRSWTSGSTIRWRAQGRGTTELARLSLAVEHNGVVCIAIP